MAIATTERLQNYLDAFTTLSSRAKTQPAWLRELRDRSFARFCAMGFPTTRDEDWRFTNVTAIAQTAFEAARENHSPDAAKLQPWRIPGAACQLVFVNGQFSRELSQIGKLPAGAQVQSLGQAWDNPIVEQHLGRYTNTERDAFCALNTAFIQDGAFIYVPRKTAVREPISLLFISIAGDAPQMAHPRNLIVVEDQSEAAIVEDYVSIGNGAFFSNVVTELAAGESAAVSHHLIEREDRAAFNVSTLRMQQARSANVSSHSVLLGGALVRNNVHPVLAGEGGECLINGLFVGAGTQHMDNYMLVEHASPHCSSRQFYNGILDERAHGVFHGRIVVHKDAQKTDAKQTNRNLLLSDDAQIDTKPQLEIYADDVKCTHGATIGQVEESALFYMRSRGIGEAEARRLLLMAFAGQCLERIQCDAVREYLETVVRQWLPAGTGMQSASGKRGRRWEELG
jgi:Fe-S cluster assembly protein SufD